jgi:hypothetical protein
MIADIPVGRKFCSDFQTELAEQSADGFVVRAIMEPIGRRVFQPGAWPDR